MFKIFKKKTKYLRRSNIKIKRHENPHLHKLVHKRKLRALLQNLKKWFIITLITLAILLIGGGLIFLLINYIVYLKTGQSILKFKKETKNVQLKEVIGLKGIPAFPNSYFLFNDFIHSEKDIQNPSFLSHVPSGYTKEEIRTVYTFLAKHKSIYILDSKFNFNDVTQFYTQKLQKLGYKYLFLVPLEDKDRIPGLYFLNPKKNLGIHIYTITGHDVWYEIISEKQAKTALTERKAALKLRSLEIMAKNGKNLPKECFWKLKYPTTWLVDMTLDPKLKIPTIFMTDNKQDSHLHIVPIKYTSKPVELLEFKDILPVAYNFINNWTHDHGIKIDFKQAATKKIIIHDVKSVEICFDNIYKDSFPNLCFLIVPNSKNTLYYAIIFWGKKIEFFDYVKRNIEPLK